jgi:ABC-2 type transport system ATP-binding protein
VLAATGGHRVVVDGLDLDVRADDLAGLIGANGAGKTTAVECIQGLRRPDACMLRVLGFMGTAVARLVRAELRLMTRDPLALTFLFVFPIVTC